MSEPTVQLVAVEPVLSSIDEAADELSVSRARLAELIRACQIKPADTAHRRHRVGKPCNLYRLALLRDLLEAVEPFVGAT